MYCGYTSNKLYHCTPTTLRHLNQRSGGTKTPQDPVGRFAARTEWHLAHNTDVNFGIDRVPQ